LASNSFNIVQLEELKSTAEVSKAVGAALYFTYIVGGLAVVSIIFSGIAGLFK
jgi:nucleoside phosphorylase